MRDWKWSMTFARRIEVALHFCLEAVREYVSLIGSTRAKQII